MAAALQLRAATTNNNNIAPSDNEDSKKVELEQNGIHQNSQDHRLKKKSTVQRMLANIIAERKKGRGGSEG